MESVWIEEDFSVNEAFDNVQSHIQKIRPSWTDWSSVRLKRFTAGVTNSIAGFYHPNDSEWREMVLIRRYGEKTELLIDRDAEVTYMKLLYSEGLGVPIYGRLTNAVLYGFAPGITLNKQTVKDKTIRTLIAHKMAEMHKINLNDHGRWLL